MSRVQLIEPDRATDPKVIDVYNSILSELGFGIVPNLFKSMAGRPGFLAANWDKFRTTVLEGQLPRTLKEMIGIAISQTNKSEYALRVHLHGLSALGISEDVLRLLVEDFDNCPLPEREKAVIRFGLLAGTRPHDLTDEHYRQIEAHGLGADEIMEVLATANLFTGVNQYTDAIALEIDAL